MNFHSYLQAHNAASPIEIFAAAEDLSIPASTYGNKQNNHHQDEENIESRSFRSPVVTSKGTLQQS
jgi:hypothetical protein